MGGLLLSPWMAESKAAVKPRRGVTSNTTQGSSLDKNRRTATQDSSLDESRRPPTAARSGYPARRINSGGGRGSPVSSNRVDMEEFNRKLEKMKAQTRQLRTQEAQLRANIDREAIGAHGQREADEEKTIMDWRQEQSRLMQKADAERKREQRESEIQDSRKFQEDKRLTREAAQQEELKLANSSYTQSLEAAQHDTERKKIQPMVEQQLRVAANLEKYRTFAEYELSEKERQKEDERIFQQDQKLSEMEQVLAKAKRERELAARRLQQMGRQAQNRTRAGAGR